MYLTNTRPDIMFSVSDISRFMHKPTKHHLGAGKRILWYVAGKIGMGLWYKFDPKPELVGYTDSRWA